MHAESDEPRVIPDLPCLAKSDKLTDEVKDEDREELNELAAVADGIDNLDTFKFFLQELLKLRFITRKKKKLQCIIDNQNDYDIKSKDTKEELLLAKALWNRGHRYRKNNKSVYGRPDLTFKKHKIAIFVDGEFFHGFNWEDRKAKLDSNREYWIAKIERNIKRDREVNRYLLSQGWKVIRFWSAFVKKNLNDCIKIIENEMINRAV